jgi:hypothetical protein
VMFSSLPPSELAAEPKARDVLCRLGSRGRSGSHIEVRACRSNRPRPVERIIEKVSGRAFTRSSTLRMRQHFFTMGANIEDISPWQR